MLKEIKSTEEEKKERSERLRREFLKRFLARQSERKEKYYTPLPPRYDDVYFEGLAALNGNEIEEQTVTVLLKPKRTWDAGMSDKEAKDLAYYERNMLALRYADGWYYDKENNWEGWSRVLSLEGGKLTFHIPDSFEIGNLPEIEPNWDGHSTEEKWQRIDDLRGIKYVD